MIKHAYQAIHRPRVTEKTTILREKSPGLYVFEVQPDLNKLEIKASIEKLFGVKVVSVRTQLVRGKMKRMGRNLGKRPNWKKAYVQLREGEKALEFFEGT
jgi:large subunit ribosomal protein L23